MITYLKMFIFMNKIFDIYPIDKNFPADLNIGELTAPDLTSPEPLGCTYIDHKLLDRIEPFCGHIMGTVSFNHLIFHP